MKIYSELGLNRRNQTDSPQVQRHRKSTRKITNSTPAQLFELLHHHNSWALEDLGEWRIDLKITNLMLISSWTTWV